MREERRHRLCRAAARFAALAVGVVLIAWAIVSFRVDGGGGEMRAGHAGGSWSPEGRPSFDPHQPSHVDLKIALVCDYYEHVIEHAPPRDPSGCMQRRESNYVVPSSPFGVGGLLRDPTPVDRDLLRWLEARRSAFLSGGPPCDPGEEDALRELAIGCSLAPGTLMELGRAFNFLAGDGAAAPWYRAGIAKALRQLASSDAAAGRALKPLLDQLDQTKVLWRLRDYEALAARFEFASRVQGADTIEGRRSRHLWAECLFNQGNYSLAAEKILDVRAAHDRVGDLGALDQSDLVEMDWMCGLLLLYAGSPADAIPYLRDVSELDSVHSEHAMATYATALARDGRIRDATEAYSRLKKAVPKSAFLSGIRIELNARTAATATGSPRTAPR